MINKTITIAIMIFGLSLINISTAAAAATISIGNGSAGVGGTVVVPLMINSVTGAASVEVKLTYNPSVVIPVSITNSDFDLPPHDPPIDPQSGYIIINAMQFAAGLEGSVKIGDITLQAVGNEGESSPLNVTDVILQDMAMQDIPVDAAVNGTFKINGAPVLDPIGSRSVDKGQTLSFTISAADPDEDALTFSASNLPAGASFDPAARTFSWTPENGQTGEYKVHFEVTDGSLIDAEDVTITILDESSDSSMSITPSSTQITPGDSFTLTIPITPATPITGAQFDLLFNSSLATVTIVTEGNLLNQDGALTMFNSGTINNAAGTVTNVYGSILGETNVSSQGSLATISMTAGSTTGYLNLNLTNVIISDTNSNAAPYTLTNATVLIDTAPVLGSIGARSIDEENTLAFTLSASDADSDILTYSAANLPDGASFNTASGAFSWTPADGQTGTYVVNFEVTDSYLSDSEAVTITVNDVNHAPVITAFVPEDGSVFDETDTINIDVTATDADGQALTYTIRIDGVTQSSGPGYAWGTDYSTAGAHTIDIIVSDGIDQVTDRHTITVNNVHQRWDVNEDWEVNILDITLIGQKYGTSIEAPYPRWDVNQDGVVNVQDLTITGYYFGETVA